MKKLIFICSLFTTLIHAQPSITDFTLSYDFKACGSAVVQFYYENGYGLDLDSVLWEFGDGKSSNKLYNFGTSHDYWRGGNFSVKLTMWQDGVQKVIEKPNAIILKQKPSIKWSYTASDSLLRAPVTFNFSAEVKPIEGELDTFYWQIFEHPNSLYTSDLNPTFTYKEPGDHIVFIVAKNSVKCSTEYRVEINILDSLQVNQFNFLDSCEGGTFNDQGTKQFIIKNDSLKVFGTIKRNCCGTHTAVLNWHRDTLFIPTFETNATCDCNCLYNFNIDGPKITKDSVIVVFDNDTIIVRKNDQNGIEEWNSGAICVFPNPATKEINIDITSMTDEKLSFNVYGLNGMLVLSEKTFNNAEIKRLNVSGFEKGTYILVVEKNKKVLYSEKIIIQ